MIAYREYTKNLESAINANTAAFFPLDKEQRKACLLKLAKEIGVALASFDKSDILDFIQVYYGQIIVKYSFDSTGVVLDTKDWAKAIWEGVEEYKEVN